MQPRYVRYVPQLFRQFATATSSLHGRQYEVVLKLVADASEIRYLREFACEMNRAQRQFVLVANMQVLVDGMEMRV